MECEVKISFQMPGVGVGNWFKDLKFVEYLKKKSYKLTIRSCTLLRRTCKFDGQKSGRSRKRSSLRSIALASKLKVTFPLSQTILDSILLQVIQIGYCLKL